MQLKRSRYPKLQEIAVAVLPHIEDLHWEHVKYTVEGILSHFFPAEAEQPYSDINCRWFLELANQQTQWQEYMQTDSVSLSQKQREGAKEGKCLTNLGQALSIYVFKKYLGRLLGEMSEEQDGESGPLNMYQPKVVIENVTYKHCTYTWNDFH